MLYESSEMYTFSLLKQDKNHIRKRKKSLYKFWLICYIHSTIHQSWVCYTSSENAGPHFHPGVKCPQQADSKVDSYEIWAFYVPMLNQLLTHKK